MSIISIIRIEIAGCELNNKSCVQKRTVFGMHSERERKKTG